MPTRTVTAALVLLVACGEGSAPDSGPGAAAADTRPESITDTLMIEGMAEPISLRLFRSPDGFPLPFSVYVPEDMATEGSTAGDGAAVSFIAEFGGVRNDRALIHLFVHPAGTDPQQALALVRAYEAAAGVPVSRGLESLEGGEASRRMPWADHAYVIEYQSGGDWYLGSVGIGTQDGSLFHLLTHYPAEYADGFGPRSALILDSWRWADGQPLRAGSAAPDFTIPSARPDPAP